jgi:hypothetical protein
MDTSTLVSDLINDGQRIVDRVPSAGIEITAAFWIRSIEDSLWYFYVVSPIAESEPLNHAYARVMTLVRQMPGPHWIDPLEIRLIGPSNPIAKSVLAIHERHPGPNTHGINWHGKDLCNERIEGAFLYPLPVMATN